MNFFCKINNVKKPEDELEKQSHNSDSISGADYKKLMMVEYTSQAYASFYTTSMEKDKSILTLSVAGIGFLVTLLKLASYLYFYDMIFFFIAALSYLCAIFCIVTLFSENKSYIINLVKNQDIKLQEHKLEQLDKIAIRAFYLGIVMSLLMAISTSSALFLERNNKMTNEKAETKQVIVEQGNSYAQASELRKSYQGATAMQPDLGTPTQTESQSAQGQQTGAAAMKPDLQSEN